MWNTGSILGIYLHKVDLIYVGVDLIHIGVDSITLYKYDTIAVMNVPIPHWVDSFWRELQRNLEVLDRLLLLEPASKEQRKLFSKEDFPRELFQNWHPIAPRLDESGCDLYKKYLQKNYELRKKA